VREYLFRFDHWKVVGIVEKGKGGTAEENGPLQVVRVEREKKQAESSDSD